MAEESKPPSLGENESPAESLSIPSSGLSDSRSEPASEAGDLPAKIAVLLSSFEAQVGTLKSHITDLETRLTELRSSRDRLHDALNEFLNVQGLMDLLRTTQEPLRVVDALLRLVRKFLPFENLSVYLFDETSKGFQPLGPASTALNRAVQSQFEEGILDWVISERRPVVVPWLESFGAETQRPEKNLLIVPMLVGDHPLGVVLLATGRPAGDFTSHELRLVHFAVSHAAVAIQNALRTREIHSTKDFLNSLLENAGDIIFALDQQGRFTYLNPRIEELGFRKEELIFQSFQSFFKSSEVGDRILNTLTRGSKQTFDLELNTRLARRQQFAVSLTAVRSERGEKLGALGIMRNMTELNRLQKKLLQSERLAAYTQTVITLNHEINNPLTAVLGNIFLLEKDAERLSDEKLINRLKVIKENCQRIQSVIKKLERIDELKTVSYLGDTKMVDISGISEENK